MNVSETGTKSFADVDSSKYYADAILANRKSVKSNLEFNKTLIKYCKILKIL